MRSFFGQPRPTLNALKDTEASGCYSLFFVLTKDTHQGTDSTWHGSSGTGTKMHRSTRSGASPLRMSW